MAHRGSRLGLVLVLCAALAACTGVSADAEFFGRVAPPEGQVLRYISGSEPESMDPQVGTGQPEARIYLALYDGLTEYHPRTGQPIPSLAERWEVNGDNTEFVFHLRRNARWSDGEPITADDMVYSWRRALSPSLAARNAYLAFHIRYSQAYNERAVFVRDPATGDYLVESEGSEAAGDAGDGAEAIADTPFHALISGPRRITLPGDASSRQALLDEDQDLAARVAGKEFVPVGPEHLGVEAVDPYTFRVTLNQPAPFFAGLVAHQFFRPVPEQAVEAHGETWTRPGNIVTSGPFHLDAYEAYNKIVLVRSPTFWDAARVRLDEITFYPMEEATTMMNLYKAGEVDAVYNHVVPVAWLDQIRPLLDYMDAPENAIEYYVFNTTEPPMDDVRVRRAFNAAIDKEALAEYRRVVKPLTAFTPEGIYPGYPQPVGDRFDPARARRLLAEAGYAEAEGNYDPSAFPISAVELTYNTSESNRQVAEFVQAQWKQNLDLTVPLKNMEWRSYLEDTANLAFKGLARRGWVGDYMDPFTFLELFYIPTGNNGTGWWDPVYVEMLDRANRTLDPDARYRLMAEAEAYMLDVQPVIPLVTQSTNWMKKPYVKGMYPNPGTMHPWKFVYIEHDPALWDRGLPDLTAIEETIETIAE